ncbi:MAG: DNA mismatch repair protein MutS [Planctomycetia bacterium]|nr:DNA mismatch repair protein MutS [Planctomycetia bacterium]
MSIPTSAAALKSEPSREYSARLAARTQAAARCARWDRRIVYGRRLLLFAVIGYVVFDPTEIQALVPLAIALVPLAFWQNAVLRRWRRASRAAAYYRRGLARLENRWIGRGEDGRRYLTDAHLYAEDLDIFGPGSLFQLLCTARTPMGREALAGWLGASDDFPAIRQRQQAVDRLRGDLDLREALATLDADVTRIVPEEAVAWARAPAIFGTPTVRVAGLLVAWALVASMVGAVVLGGAWWLAVAVTIALEAAIYVARRHAAREVARHVGDAGHALGVLFRLRAVLRQRPATVPLSDIAAAIDRGLGFPARPLAELYGLFLQNSFLHALKVQSFPPLEAWRLAAREGIDQALAAAGRLEALAALSAYAYEHPRDPFPDLVDDGPRFEGVGLGHPLMPEGTCVTNDLSLGGDRRLVLISGSNMSGKSTLLRTVGTNVVLAMAGAPVRAARLTISPLTLGTAMRFRDSVHEGASYFYAVLVRLRAVLNLTGHGRPLLFLFDEILQGTNSQDRLVGAEAVMRRLLEAGAIGLMTTHDLALTKIVDDLAPRAVNMHCEDQLVDGRMTFDYTLRPGVVTKSNALALMRSMGLDV